jgi:hypothetical protein
MAAMCIVQIQTLLLPWSLVSSAVDVYPDSYVSLAFRSKMAIAHFCSRSFGFDDFEHKIQQFSFGQQKKSYAPSRARGTEYRYFRKTAAVIYGGFTSINRAHIMRTCCNFVWETATSSPQSAFNSRTSIVLYAFRFPRIFSGIFIS